MMPSEQDNPILQNPVSPVPSHPLPCARTHAMLAVMKPLRYSQWTKHAEYRSIQPDEICPASICLCTPWVLTHHTDYISVDLIHIAPHQLVVMKPPFPLTRQSLNQSLRFSTTHKH